MREGFVSLGAGGKYTATDSIDSLETAAILKDLDGYGRRLGEGPAAAIATNMKLVSVCMRALPELLAGSQPRLSNSDIYAPLPSFSICCCSARDSFEPKF